MNRDEFMQQLARLLSDMPESERMEAIRYYNDYFDEAGPDNESKVIQELGSPGKVAAIIKADLKDSPGREEFRKKEHTNEEPRRMFSDSGAAVNESREDTPENSSGMNWKEAGADQMEGSSQQETNAGWTNGSNEQKTDTGWTNGYNQQQLNNDWNTGGYRRQNSAAGAHTTLRRRRGAGSWALIIILLVFISPAIIGVGGGILGALFGILAAIFGVLVAVLSAGVGMVGGGIALVFKGMIKFFTVPASGFVSIGGGLICIALGIFILIFFCWLTFRLFPRFCRAVVNFISRLLHRRKGAAVQ